MSFGSWVTRSTLIKTLSTTAHQQVHSVALRNNEKIRGRSRTPSPPQAHCPTTISSKTSSLLIFNRHPCCSMLLRFRFNAKKKNFQFLCTVSIVRSVRVNRPRGWHDEKDGIIIEVVLLILTHIIEKQQASKQSINQT